MIRIEKEIYLYLLLLIPLFVIMFLFYMRWKHVALKRFMHRDMIENLAPKYSVSKNVIKFSIYMLTLALLVICIANPQMGSKVEKVKQKGVDVVVCLDISNSMNAQDIQPSRLKRSKQAITQLINKLRGDRIGLIVFAGGAYTQLPLTSDYGAAKMYVNVISTDDMKNQGTAIGSAIDMAIESFEVEDKEQEAQSKHNKAIIIISDGEDHESDAIEMAKKARSINIQVSTVGMGLPAGCPIPEEQNGRVVGYKKDRNGNVIITHLNEQILKEIAAAGGGSYMGANNTTTGIENILRKLKELDRIEYDERNFTDYETKYMYVLIVALFLIVMELFIFERKNKFFSKLNLFGEHKKEK